MKKNVKLDRYEKIKFEKSSLVHDASEALSEARVWGKEHIAPAREFRWRKGILGFGDRSREITDITGSPDTSEKLFPLVGLKESRRTILRVTGGVEVFRGTPVQIYVV